MHYEVVLVNRETGEAMTTIAVSSNEAGAADVACEYNSKRFGDDIDDYRLLMFTHDKELDKNPEEKLYADYFEVEDITERKEEERMQNSVNDKANVNWDGAEMVKVGVYKDGTGLYTETECNEDNWVELDFPKAIVEEWFWTSDAHTYFPGYTMERWLKEESSDEPELGNLIGFAKQRGFELKRDDGIDLKKEREEFKKNFLEAVREWEIPIQIGSWDVEFDFGSTQGDVHKGITWEGFCDWLIDDIADVGIVELSKVKITNIEYHGIDDKEHFINDLIDSDEMSNRIDYRNGGEYKEYFMSHPLEFAECSRHNGCLTDFDWMIHLKELLNMPISWDLYHYIDGKYPESLMDLEKEDYAMLMQWVNEYALGKECD